MIQAILCYKFVINEDDAGKIKAEFKPIKFVFQNREFSESNYSELITQDDVFGIFYQHTTGIYNDSEVFSNYYTGRLKATSYRVLSYFRQEVDGSQFLTISFFDLDDEIDIFEDFIKVMAKNLDALFIDLLKFTSLKKLREIAKVSEKIEKEMKFAIFQIDRLSKLDKLQKVALIFQSEERLKILETIREHPISKKEMTDIIEKLNPNPNIDLLLEPFLELNLVRRDWVKGKRDKRRAVMKNQGEYLFLIKDITLLRLPNQAILKNLKENREELYLLYEEKVKNYFSNYDPNKQSIEEVKNLASSLLNPDIYDFYTLMQKNYYPLIKLPKIFSDFVNSEFIVNKLEELNVITKVKDNKKQEWVIILTDIKPLVFFPEFLIPKIKESYKSKDPKKKISHEIAKKALDLLEVTYQEKVEF